MGCDRSQSLIECVGGHYTYYHIHGKWGQLIKLSNLSAWFASFTCPWYSVGVVRGCSNKDILSSSFSPSDTKRRRSVSLTMVIVSMPIIWLRLGCRASCYRPLEHSVCKAPSFEQTSKCAYLLYTVHVRLWKSRLAVARTRPQSSLCGYQSSPSHWDTYHKEAMQNDHQAYHRWQLTRKKSVHSANLRRPAFL